MFRNIRARKSFRIWSSSFKADSALGLYFHIQLFHIQHIPASFLIIQDVPQKIKSGSENKQKTHYARDGGINLRMHEHGQQVREGLRTRQNIINRLYEKCHQEVDLFHLKMFSKQKVKKCFSSFNKFSVSLVKAEIQEEFVGNCHTGDGRSEKLKGNQEAARVRDRTKQ